ncbi:MAG: glycosyltransferase [Acidimicrobiia bacterium]
MRSPKSKSNFVEKSEESDKDINLKENNLSNVKEPEGLAWPSVVCVVVTNDPGEWFDESIKSIMDSGYPDLTTLILDLSINDGLKERVSKLAPKAFLRKFDETYNFASAINDAVNSIEGATYVLICHDDVIINKGAISSMVQEAFRSNASMVGPKILDGENPDCLLEVGGMIDRFGVPYSGLEFGEVDQSQHDGVRDVFYVSSAAMLVRADLFRALGGFDELCFPGAEDIDLSWRAHLVGARVLVQPDATVLHHQISESINSQRNSTKAIVAQHRMRAVLKNSSKVSLFWILPISFVLHSIEGIFFLLRLNPYRSVVLFKGWVWNIKHLRNLRRSRKEVQHTRTVSDRVISGHQIAGSSRIRRFFNSISRRRQNTLYKNVVASSKVDKSTQTNYGTFYTGAFFIYLLAIRNLIFGQIESIGSFVKWGSFSNQISSLLHGGFPTVSSPNYSSSLQRIVALILTPIFGFNAAFAQRIFVLSLIPIAVIGLHYLLKNLALSSRSIIAGSISYGLVIFGMGIFENGKLGVLVTAASLPYLIDGILKNRSRKYGLSAASIIAFNPAAIIILLITSFAYLLVGVRSDARRKTLRTITFGLFLSIVINLGLVYDSINRIDRSTFGFTEVFTSNNNYFFGTGFSKNIILAMLFVGLTAILISKGMKYSILKVVVFSTILSSSIAIVGININEPIFDNYNVVLLFSFTFSLSVGYCLNSFSSELTEKSFGLYHLINVIALFIIIGTLLLQLPTIVNGRLNLSSSSWSSQIENKFQSRVVYLGNTKKIGSNPSMLPGNKGFVIASNTEIKTSNSIIGPSSKLDDDFRKIYSVIIKNETNHGGYLFSKMGIGVIVVPTALSPDSKISKNDSELLAAFDRQIDLVRIKDRDGLVVYNNLALNKQFKSDQISNPVNIANELINPNIDKINKIKYSKLGLINYLIISLNGFVLLLVFLWPRRKELISNAYSSVKKMQANISEDTIEEPEGNVKKIKESEIIDLTIEKEQILTTEVKESETIKK